MLALASEQRIDGDALRDGVPAFRALKRSDFKTGTSRRDARQPHFRMIPRTTLCLYRAGERDRRMLFGLKHKPRQLMLGTGEQPEHHS
jgi:hypothetical protein